MVNITRQAYRGGGSSVQLAFDVVFPDTPGPSDPSRGTYLTLWSWELPSLDAFVSVALGELDARGVLEVERGGLVRVDRF